MVRKLMLMHKRVWATVRRGRVTAITPAVHRISAREHSKAVMQLTFKSIADKNQGQGLKTLSFGV